MSIIDGYSMGNGGYYKTSDMSGPYAIGSDGIPKLIAGGYGGGGDDPSNSGKAMRLALSQDFHVNVGEVKQIGFDQIPFNDGFTWNAEHEIEAQEAGTVLISASVGVVLPDGMENDLTISVLLFKNDVPLRQNSITKKESPFCIAKVNVIDKCVFEDKYSLYVFVTGGDDVNATVSKTVDVTSLEIAYL